MIMRTGLAIKPFIVDVGSTQVGFQDLTLA
jgi:hypothetical protein